MQRLINSLLLFLPILLTSQSTLENNLYNFEPGKQRVTTITGGMNLFYLTDEKELEGNLFAGVDHFFNHGKFQGDMSIYLNSRNDFPSLSLNARYYFAKDVFVSLGTNFKGNAFSQRTFSGGIGKGRINLVNELSTAERIIEKLIPHLSDPASDKATTELAHHIRTLKNERFLANVGSVDEEISVIIEELQGNGFLNNDIDRDAILSEIRSIYKYEPLINRFSGSRLSFNVINGLSDLSYLGRRVFETNHFQLKYEMNKYISASKQWNNEFSVDYSFNEYLTGDNLISVDDYNSISVNWRSALHFLPKANSRLSVLTDIGYRNYRADRTAGRYSYNLFLTLEYEKRISRNLGITLGVTTGYVKGSGFNYVPTMKIRF